MHPRKSMITLLAGVVALCSLPLSANATPKYEAPKISPIEAKKAAAWLVLNNVLDSENETIWKKSELPKVGKPEDVYDPAGNLVAYLVDIYDNELNENGYVMVSAFEDEEPILAFADKGESIKFDVTKLDESPNDIDAIKPVWLGGVAFAGVVKYKDYSKKKDQIIDPNNKKVDKDLSSLAYPSPVTEKKENRDLWKAIKKIEFGAPGQTNPSDGVSDIDPIGWETNYSSINRLYVDNPYDQNQWYYGSDLYTKVQQATGCSPTSGSNLIMYLAQTKSSLNPNNSQQDIVMKLRTYMKTTQDSTGTGLTEPTDIAPGLNSYMKANGVSHVAASSVYLSSFSDLTSRLNQWKYPMLQSYWNQTYFGNHTVTVVGYKEFVRSTGTNSRYVVVRNNYVNDTTFNLWVKWGTWNTNLISYVVGTI